MGVHVDCMISVLGIGYGRIHRIIEPKRQMRKAQHMAKLDEMKNECHKEFIRKVGQGDDAKAAELLKKKQISVIANLL